MTTARDSKPDALTEAIARAREWIASYDAEHARAIEDAKAKAKRQKLRLIRGGLDDAR